MSLTKTYEQFDPKTRWTDRIVSSSGDWSGNVYDFYFRVYNKIAQDIDDMFFEVENETGLKIDFDSIDKIIENVITVALRRFK